MSEVRRLALHAIGPTTIIVSRPFETRTTALRVSELESWRYVKGEWAEGPKRLKLAIVEVVAPDWLAKKERVLS